VYYMIYMEINCYFTNMYYMYIYIVSTHTHSIIRKM
jgi:hypothetical protein